MIGMYEYGKCYCASRDELNPFPLQKHLQTREDLVGDGRAIPGQRKRTRGAVIVTETW